MHIATITALVGCAALAAAPRVTSYFGPSSHGSMWSLESTFDGGGCSATLVVHPDGGCLLSGLIAEWDATGVSDSLDPRFYECGEKIPLCAGSWTCNCALHCGEALVARKNGCALTVDGRTKSTVKCGSTAKLCGLVTTCDCAKDGGP